MSRYGRGYYSYGIGKSLGRYKGKGSSVTYRGFGGSSTTIIEHKGIIITIKNLVITIIGLWFLLGIVLISIPVISFICKVIKNILNFLS